MAVGTAAAKRTHTAAGAAPHAVTAAGQTQKEQGKKEEDEKLPPSRVFLMRRRIGPGQCLVEVTVPESSVGLLIGKGGATIKALHKHSGAFVQTQRDDEEPSGVAHEGEESGRTVYLVGTLAQIETASGYIDLILDGNEASAVFSGQIDSRTGKGAAAKDGHSPQARMSRSLCLRVVPECCSGEQAADDCVACLCFSGGCGGGPACVAGQAGGGGCQVQHALQAVEAGYGRPPARAGGAAAVGRGGLQGLRRRAAAADGAAAAEGTEGTEKQRPEEERSVLTRMRA